MLKPETGLSSILENLIQNVRVLAERAPAVLEKNLFPNLEVGCPRPECARLLLGDRVCILI